MECNDYVLWGALGHAKVLVDILEKNGANIVALFENSRDTLSLWPDVPIYYGREGFESWRLSQEHVSHSHAAVAIGGSRGKDRCAIADLFVSSGLKLPSIIHPTATCAKSAEIGEGSHVLAGANVGPDVTLERCVILNTHSSVDHECSISEGVHIAPGTTLCGCIEVGAHSFVGPGTVIVPRVSIGSNTIIGAGSVVTRNIGDNVIAWGSPAKVIRENKNERV